MLTPHELREVCQAGKDRDPAWYRIHRRLSIHVTARLLQTPITLNQISALMLSLGVLGAALNAFPSLFANALGWACLYGAFLLDKVDGEVARYRRQCSVTGILLDRFHHRLVEPLLFLAVGLRASTAGHSPLPLIAALATMLAANIVEETQQLPPFIAAKHARETRQWPASGRAPSARWERVAAWMRVLKTFRTFITVLPLVAFAELLEAWLHRPATTWLLVTSAVALWVYALFQAAYYTAGRLEVEIDALTRDLPPLPGHDPVAQEAAEAPAEAVMTVLDAVAPETPIAWPLPGRSRRSVTLLAVQHADEERARAAKARADLGAGAAPLAALLLVGLLAGRASAGTYYVDGASAQCSNAGPGTILQPYCTIAAAVAARGTAGNTILVQPGTYRETITFPASGTSSAPIVLRANGPGVVIDGADDFSPTNKWVQYSGNVWVASSVNWSPLQVFADGARLTAAGNSPNALQNGTYKYVAGQGLYVNAGGGNPGLHGTLVGRRANALVLNGRSWITVDGFTVTRTEDRSLDLSSSASDDAILNCTITFSNKYGIYVSGGARVRIANNVVTDHNNHGIVLTTGATNCLVENNEGARNSLPGTRSANGVYVYGASNNTFRRNRWHDNQDTGQHFQSGANNNLSYDNVSWNNGDHGYDHLGATGTIHFNDVAYGNYKDGFSIEGTSPNTQLANCIAVNNGLTTNEFDLWVDNTSASGLVSNDNIFWNSTSQQPFKYIKTLYATLASYQAASGQDSRTLQVDPRFVNPAAGNFHLLAGSPAIDNGNSSSPSWPATDADGNARVNDATTPDGGLGPIAYSDRGAFEYQPLGLPPIATLVATPAAGIAPAIVTLDASGSTDPEGNIASYWFDFGDGTGAGPQSTPTIVHTYSAGSYTATVTVVDNMGLSSSTTAAVFANQRPVAALAGTPLSGRAPITVAFNGSGSSDVDGAVASYTFDFGDGTVVGPQAAATASHVYGTGDWQARLTVTDNKGAVSAPATLAVTVGAPNQPPAAAVTLNPSSGSAPLAVTADASASADADGSLVSYRFDFGDGTIVGPQAGASATHTYAGGPHTVTVLVTDNDGATASASASLFVSTPNQAPNGDIVAPAGDVTRVAGQSVTFAATATDPDGNLPLTFAWDFGGGSPPSTQQNPGAVVFSHAGTYTVTFTVRDALGLADPTPHTRVVTVNPADTTVAADNVHWTLTSQTSVTFDWRGPSNAIHFGLTTAYDQTVLADTPSPLPYSSPGPYWEAKLTGLTENTTYHYSVGGGSDHTFHTPPPRGSSGFTICAEGDIGDAQVYPGVAGVQSLIAGQQPSFVLAIGDLSYANVNGQGAVDRFFNDVQAWSLDAAFMPAWGNHEWESATDDLRNYKGRVDLPNAQTTPYIPAPNDGGEDWYWFDHGDVRFIAYPEPFPGAWDDWYPRANALMDQAQADPAIHHIVTFGHRPAYSSGHHSGESRLKLYLDQLGAAHSKYQLNLNGHSHDYERTYPQSGVVHVTAGASGSNLEEEADPSCRWAGGCPPPAFSAVRMLHRGVLRLRFTAGGIEGAYLCGPAGNDAQNPDDISCTPGTIVDSFIIGTPTPDQAPVVVVPATVNAAEGSTVTVNVTATDPDGDPILNLSPDLSRLPVGNDAVFTPAADLSGGQLVWHPTYADSGSYLVTFAASNNLSGSASTVLRIQNTDRAPVVSAPGSAFELSEGSPFSLGVTAADPDGEAVTSLVANVSPLPPGGAPAFTGNAASGTLAWTPMFADSGTYTVTFTASNALQGGTAVTLHVGNVDRAPVLTAPASIVAPSSGPLEIAFTVADPDSDAIDSLTADLGELPAGSDAVFTPGPNRRSGTLAWTPQPEDLGLYHVRFTATNALSATVITAVSVNSIDRAPVITAPASAAASEGAQVAIAVSVVDPDSNAVNTFTADLSALPAGNNATFTIAPDHRNGVLRWTPGYQDAGSYVVRWLAANALADTAQTVVQVANTDRAPVVVAPATQSVATGSTITFNVSASDADGDAIGSLTANFSSLPAGHTATFTAAPNAQSGVFTWTPAAGDTGTRALVFTASDALNGVATTMLTVTRPNQPPTAVVTATPRTGNAPLAVTANGAGSTDPEGTILSYRFDFGDGVIVGPQASATANHAYAAGTWTLTVNVTDAAGAVSSSSTTVTVAGTGPGANLVGNPSFEANTNGWNAYSGSSYVRVAGGFDGGSCLQVSGPASLSGFGLNDSPNWVAATAGIGTRYRFGAWVRSAAALGSGRLQIREYVGNTKVGATVLSPPVQLTPNWQWVTVDYVVQASGSTLDFQVYDQPVVQGEVFQMDNVTINLVPAGTAVVSAATSDSTGVATSGRAPVAAESLAGAGEPAPARFSVSIAPSVAAPATTLTFATTVPGPVRIELYDLAGRRVRNVLDAPFMAPGLHNVTLDGRGEHGEPLGRGVYFYRVQAPERSATGRFVIVR